MLNHLLKWKRNFHIIQYLSFRLSTSTHSTVFYCQSRNVLSILTLLFSPFFIIMARIYTLFLCRFIHQLSLSLNKLSILQVACSDLVMSIMIASDPYVQSYPIYNFFFFSKGYHACITVTFRGKRKLHPLRVNNMKITQKKASFWSFFVFLSSLCVATDRSIPTTKPTGQSLWTQDSKKDQLDLSHISSWHFIYCSTIHCLLFDYFINNLTKKAQGMLFKLVGNTKIKYTVSVLNDRIIIQNDFDKLEQWPKKYIYIWKCSIPHLLAA